MHIEEQGITENTKELETGKFHNSCLQFDLNASFFLFSNPSPFNISQENIKTVSSVESREAKVMDQITH